MNYLREWTLFTDGEQGLKVSTDLFLKYTMPSLMRTADLLSRRGCLAARETAAVGGAAHRKLELQLLLGATQHVTAPELGLDATPEITS